MAAESFVDHDNPTENASSDTKEDVKNVLFQLKSILNGTDPSITSESTVSEPTIPTKSSSEILSELFSAFNAKPPIIPENVEDVGPQPRPSPYSSSDNETLSYKTKVHRKSKSGKKHKHKHKHKHKKRVKQEESDPFSSNSSSGITSPIPLPNKRIKVEKHRPTSALGLDVHSNITRGLGLPIRVKKEKDKSKHKTTKSRSKHSSATKGVSRSVKLKHVGLANCPNITRPKPRPSLLGLSIKITNDLTYDQDRIIDFTPDAEIPPVRHDLHTDETNTLDPKSLDLEPPRPIGLHQGEYDNIVTKIKIEPGTESSKKQEPPPNIESCTSSGQTKNTGKISIKNLKFSSVFEATVREVEEQAKAKADQYEEGEISSSDCDDRLEFSPISSLESDEDRLVTSTNSFYNPIHKKLKKNKKRHLSESGERSSKHHHSSKRRKDSASEIEHRYLDLSTSSQQLKYHDKKKKKGDKLSVSKKKRKQSKSPYRKEKSHKDSRSTSKSPTCKKSKTNEDKNATGKISQPFKLCSSVEVKNRMIVSASGRKTVEELTNFCKRLSKKEQGHSKNGTEENDDYGSDSDSEIEQPFNHPFQVKERPQSIVVNIRNSIQLPIKSLQEKAAEQSKQLCVQFPVSSGQRHRRAEDEWVPVTPKPVKCKKQLPAADKSPKATPAAVNSVSGAASEKDIGSIVTQKLRAMRTLQENPTDVEALGAMYRANQDMLHWAEAKQNQVPAAAGASGLAVNPQLITPNTSCSGRVGMGMSLLQKMGWKPGEGLGKNREGALEPLKLEIKMDKKGLITAEDFKVPPKAPTRSASGPGKQPSDAQSSPVVQNVIQRPPPDKNPISKLVEFCGRRRWRGPQFELCHESGPAHRKNFLFKVLVNGTEYKPMVTSLSKKLAKAEAASVCLQALRDLN